MSNFGTYHTNSAYDKQIVRVSPEITRNKHGLSFVALLEPWIENANFRHEKGDHVWLDTHRIVWDEVAQ